MTNDTQRTAPENTNFGFGENEAELTDVVRRYLAEQLPITRLRELVAADPAAVYEQAQAAGWDRDAWSGLVDMGLTAIAVPERAGGTPVTMAGLAAVVEQGGFRALPSPLASTIAATLVLNHCSAETAQPWLEAIAGGASATLATTDQGGSWQPADCSMHAAVDGDGYRLTGNAAFVQDASKADLFVVLGQTDHGHVLTVVPADAAGLTIVSDQIHDLTRDQATLNFDSVAVDGAAVVSTDGSEVLDQAWPGVLMIAAADLCGVAEWLLETVVDYAKDRVQFDRPIGFFQAVKHPIVNVMIDIDRARSLLYHAASLIDADSPEAHSAARMAKSAASDAASFAADRTVQLHGGIGFTWEHDAHIYFKRAMHGTAIYGDGRYQRQHLANVLID